MSPPIVREHELEHGGIVVGRSPDPQSLGRRGRGIDREALRTQALRDGLTEALVIFDDEQSQWAISMNRLSDRLIPLASRSIRT